MIKKLILVILGIILSLVVLECGLRLAGVTILSYQQYKNSKALKNKSQYTIMCLGQSTTQGQYPIQLQNILNKKYPNKFSVIDCGISGSNFESTLELLDNNINKYKPNITICMFGITTISDSYELKIPYNKYIGKKLEINLKLYDFFILLKEHIKSLLKTKKVFVQNKDMIELAYEYRNKKDYVKSEQILKSMLKENPKNEEAFVLLAVLYKDYMPLENIGYKMAIKGLKENYDIKKEWYYKIIFEYNYRKHDIQTLKFYIDKAINEDIDIFNDDKLKYFLYGFVKDYVTQEQKETILKIMIQNNVKDYGILAIDFMKQKQYKKAQEYFDKSEELRLNFQNIEEYNLYKLIIKKLINNNIKVVCMQLPIRSIKSLQEQLKDESYYDKITFISNEKIFKEALMQKNYEEIFIDQFEGDSGHCTDLGNTMIAENVVETLEKILNLKQN